VIDHRVLARVLDGTGVPADPTNMDDYRRIAPDPCANDDATSVIYVEATQSLYVSANLSMPEGMCADLDWSGPDTPRSSQVYFPPGAPDDDMDGVPNGIEPDYSTRELFGRAALERFIASFQAMSGDATYSAAQDLDDDGDVDFDDYALLLGQWGHPRTQ
jgi:hypothetical protein